MCGTKPNLLFIMADQLRYDALGYAGRFSISTPNLDRLASEGAFFSKAYTPIPVCAPARQSLLSGRSADSFGALWNYDFIPTNTVRGNDPSWIHALVERGYRTSLVGQWHASPEEAPAAFGYETYIPFGEYEAYVRTTYPDIQYTGGWMGEASPLPLEDSRTHYMARRTMALLDEYAAAEAPFLLMWDFADPHLPCRPSEPFASMYTGADIEPWDSFGDPMDNKPYIQRQQLVNWDLTQTSREAYLDCIARYYGMVSQLDDAIGRVLAHLEELGLAQNTLVIFTSDHGDTCGGHGMLDKHYILYEDVVHIPLIMRLPGVVPSGIRVQRCVSNCLDLPPTIEEIMELPPSGVRHGLSLLLLLAGEEQPARPNYTVFTSNGQQFGLFTQRGITDGRWKYIWNLTDMDEFYDLDADPGEFHNLIAYPMEQNTEVLASMRKNLYDALIRQGDPFAKSPWLKKQLVEGKKL